MIFKVVDSSSIADSEPSQFVELQIDWGWNDFGYQTQFHAFYHNNGTIQRIGRVKIATFGLPEGWMVLSDGDEFGELGNDCFSLGDEEYYTTLKAFDDNLRDEILWGLNDIAKYPEAFERAIDEDVTRISLLRFTSVETVIGQFRRMASGGVRLTNYDFDYRSPSNSSASGFRLNFQVVPDSSPPTNIHVLVGRNGVGKTTLLNNMINSLTSPAGNQNLNGSFSYEVSSQTNHFFANLISVSFSAFDEMILPTLGEERNPAGLRHSYIGLKRRSPDNPNDYEPMNTQGLTDEFVRSLGNVKIANRKSRWLRHIGTLENDPNFQESTIPALIELDGEEFASKASRTFKQLSSGHKIVLLTITRLVELLEEKSLVLIDEPESHLHPPLLSSFTRALSELLILTNGVAIIATHSPVVLQEVPKSCVWKLRRSGQVAVAERLGIESFGENVGTLTSEVFGLEVKKSGFFSMLRSTYDAKGSYEGVLEHFGNQLGMEAKAIVRVMEIEDQENEEN